MARHAFRLVCASALALTAYVSGMSGVAAGPFDLPVLGDPGDQELAPVTPSRNEGRLSSGRIAQLPASWYYAARVNSGSGLDVRTVCEGDDNDTGLIVSGQRRTRFNDNSPLAGGNGMGSYVHLAPLTPFEAFTITVFSMRRGTSYCAVDISRDAGATWTRLQEDFFGGTLVDVGPLRANDTIEAQALAAGDDSDSTAHRTRLLLFSPANESRVPLAASDGGLGGWNPRITVSGDGWRTGPNFVLVGKITRSSASNSGVETRVDLVHGPLDAEYAETAINAWRSLDVGRYYAWVYARTTMPVGDTSVYWNTADIIPTEWSCPDWPRGRLDGYAFSMSVERQNGAGATALAGRRVRLAQMGAAPNELNLFLLEFEVTQPGSYRVSAVSEDTTVTFFPSWRVYRNANASELTVASYNTLYDDGHNHQNKTLNASNLLATRGNIWRDALRVEAPRDQARFQWEADVIGLQELRKGDPTPTPSPLPGTVLPIPGWRKYVDAFRDEAERTGSRGWSYLWGRDEEYTFGTDGLGPLFIASPFYPGSDGGSIDFPDSVLEDAGCETSPNDPTWVQCELDEVGPSLGRGFNAILGKLAVRRFNSASDRPIVVVNLHLRDDDKFQDRVDQLNDLMRILDRLLQGRPTAFNPAGSSDPRHHQNRIIVLGDFNMRSHHCGEHYWLLHQLREHFGYALDSAMGGGDYDMHDEAGSFANWVDWNDWKANPGAHPTYPWWLATSRGTDTNGRGRTERYDAIMLLGKGWAYDDPVTQYQVMNDRTATTPMAPDGAAVEQWNASNLVRNGHDALGSAWGYRPNYRLSLPAGIGTNIPFVPGEPALDSDHAPIRARLRVFLR